MIGAVALAAIVTASPAQAPSDVGARIAAARVAAQSLQGPLDGAWLLQDSAGGPIYRLEIVEPAGGRGPIVGTWRDARARRDASGGFIEWISRTPRELKVRFRSRGGSITTLRLVRRSPDLWAGQMIQTGGGRAVVLRRNQAARALPGLARPGPPV